MNIPIAQVSDVSRNLQYCLKLYSLYRQVMSDTVELAVTVDDISCVTVYAHMVEQDEESPQSALLKAVRQLAKKNFEDQLKYLRTSYFLDWTVKDIDNYARGKP